MLAQRARSTSSVCCSHSLSSYLLSSLFPSTTTQAHVRHFSKRAREQQAPNLRDYTKTIPKAKQQRDDNKDRNDRGDREAQKKDRTKEKKTHPFLRDKPMYVPKKQGHGPLPAPYNYTMFGFMKKKEHMKKMINYKAANMFKKHQERVQEQKNAVFTSETLPTVLEPKQIAALIISAKRVNKSLAIFKEARASGLAKNGEVYAALVTKLCDFGQPMHALNMIEELESTPDVYSSQPAEAFVKAMGQEKAGDMVLKARKLMIKENILPLNATYVTFVKILGHANRSSDALDMIQEMYSSNVKLEEHSYKSLSLLLLKFQLFDRVKPVLDKMATNYQVTMAMAEKLAKMNFNVKDGETESPQGAAEPSALLDSTSEGPQPITETNTADNTTESADNNTSNTDSNTTSYKPFMLLRRYDVEKLAVKNQLKESKHEVLKVV